MADNDTGTGSSLIVGLAVELVAGVALGLLLAPKEGRETREMIREAIARGVARVRPRGEDEPTEEA